MAAVARDIALLTATVVLATASVAIAADPLPVRVLVTLTSVDAQPRLVLATQPLDGSKPGRWRYRTFDLAAVDERERATVELGSDGSAARLISADGARHLYLDLTRRERGHFTDEPEGSPKPDTPRNVESRAIREALLGGDPCQAQEGRELEAAARRCIATTFERAGPPPAAGPRPPWRPWRFEADREFLWAEFLVAPRPALYLPALELAKPEEVFPSELSVLEGLRSQLLIETTGLGDDGVFDALFQSYLREPRAARAKKCVVYYEVSSHPGTWLLQFWFYFPFDYGSQGSHFHDSEHMFVEVDVLGGWVRRVMGAGHGKLAGNNIYEATEPWRLPVDVPVLAAVELAKHATAPDIDRDFVFTPGIDESLYNERAKVWGVRDVIGDNNNHVIAYERTMSAPRAREDLLAGTGTRDEFVNHPDVALATCSCVLTKVPPAPDVTTCDKTWKTTPTTSCAEEQVAGHDDRTEPERIFKNAMFARHAIRISGTMGPRSKLKSAGVGYAGDVAGLWWIGDRIKLPGRVALQVHQWWQDKDSADFESCVKQCQAGQSWGWSFAYEQLSSNLFGAYIAVRGFSSPRYHSLRDGQMDRRLGHERWMEVGPLVEFHRFTLTAGFALRSTSSPRTVVRLNYALVQFGERTLGVN